MEPKTTKSFMVIPPILLAGRTAAERAYIGRLKSQNLIRQVAPKIYASVADSEVPGLIRSSWAMIVSRFYPEAVVSHKTAFKYIPSEANEVYLTSNTRRDINLPGLTLRFMKGPGALGSDTELMGAKVSSFERSLLENLSVAKKGLSDRNVSQEEIEKRLENILLIKGEEEINRIRDEARRISGILDMEKEFKRLNKIIGALLGTKSSSALMGTEGIARASGAPFEHHCLARLEILFSHLKTRALEETAEPDPKNVMSFTNKAFFESYFSNYIEGTIFDLKEAEGIVFSNNIPESRPADAHDILGTYKIVSDPNEMRKTPSSAQNLGELIRRRHAILLEKRPNVGPGEYKLDNNRAGSTVFVHPDYIQGTLDKGFELYMSLPLGLPRAIFMMFLVSDVHPFNDGNGRIARIMMNAELYSQKLSTIIIPSVYRNDYMSNIKSMTKRSIPEHYTRMLQIAHKFSALDYSNYPQVKKYIEDHNWFRESDEAKILL